MMARRNPNKAPKKPAVTISPSEAKFLPPDNKKPAYASAGIQSIMRNRKYMRRLLLFRAINRNANLTDGELQLWRLFSRQLTLPLFHFPGSECWQSMHLPGRERIHVCSALTVAPQFSQIKVP
jgi:hypothetical protein